MFARIEPVHGQRWYQESQNGNAPAFDHRARRAVPGRRRRLGRRHGCSFIFPYEIDKYDCPTPTATT